MKHHKWHHKSSRPRAGHLQCLQRVPEVGWDFYDRIIDVSTENLASSQPASHRNPQWTQSLLSVPCPSNVQCAEWTARVKPTVAFLGLTQRVSGDEAWLFHSPPEIPRLLGSRSRVLRPWYPEVHPSLPESLSQIQSWCFLPVEPHDIQLIVSFLKTCSSCFDLGFCQTPDPLNWGLTCVFCSLTYVSVFLWSFF